MKDYNLFTLDNGLRVVHSYDPMTAMVAVDVLYNVGSRDERDSLTGVAHLLEHMMFGGSVNIPDFDAAIERAGGVDNAWTSEDFTNYYDYAPAVNLDTLLWLESDRMLSLNFTRDNLEVQRAVVIEEFKQTLLNTPYGDFSCLLRELLYKVHPYRHVTIGSDVEHVARITLDDVKEFFYSHYGPDNAVLSIVGNVTLEEVKRKVEYWFGGIERRGVKERNCASEPPLEAPRSLWVKRECPSTRVAVAYPMGGWGSKDYYEGDLLTDLLAAGRSGLFRGELLREHGVFAQADASVSGHADPGYLLLQGVLTDNSAEAASEALGLLTSTAARLKEHVGERELERARAGKECRREFDRTILVNRAEQLAEAVMRGVDPEAEPAIYRAITPDDVRSAARRLMDPSRAVTLVYQPA
ncbi:MAG: insulinase family protein [Duncaniella sp.]|nr:insulinase family protein [Duncaniella sp.]